MSEEIGVRPDEELQDLPFQEEPPLPPEYHGQYLSIGERIRARREERLMDAAPHQCANTEPPSPEVATED